MLGALAAASSADTTLLIIASVAAVCVLLVVAERLLLSPRALVTPEDVITAPGLPISVRVLVERRILPFWDPPLRDAEVVLEGETGRSSARTNARGVAEFGLPAAEAGRHRYVARLAAPIEGDPAPLLVEVVPPDRPVLVADIDGTLANVHQVVHAFRDNAAIRPHEGAAATLTALQTRYSILYLTARDHIFRAKTLDWLRANGFPEAPVLVRRRRFWSQSAARHKRERLAELASRVPLAAGIGDLPADIAVYRERQMKAFLIGRRTAEGAVRIESWRELPRHLEGSV